MKAIIYVLEEQVLLEEAKHMLWERESTSNYNPQRIKEISHFHKIDTVIYTSFEPYLANSTPCELAELAIMSVCQPGVAQNQDGITYLIKAKDCGIETPKMKDYEEKIISLTRTNNLSEALESLRESCP